MSTRSALVLVDPVQAPIPPPTPPSPADLARRGCAALQAAGAATATRLVAARHDDRGQSTAEYALVILGAAAVAALLVAWASQTNKVSRLLDVILDSVINRFR
jgi:hypothetical protein